MRKRHFFGISAGENIFYARMNKMQMRICSSWEVHGRQQNAEQSKRLRLIAVLSDELRLSPPPDKKLFDKLQFDGAERPRLHPPPEKTTPFQYVLRIFAGRRDLEGLANWGFMEHGHRCTRQNANHALKWRTFSSGRPSRGTGRRAGALRPLCVFCGSTLNCNKSKSFSCGHPIRPQRFADTLHSDQVESFDLSNGQKSASA